VEAVTTKEKRIMVVDDDRDVNRLISYNLSKSGFYPECVYDGYEAQEKLKKGHFDIIILDVMLPGPDGFSICKAIKDDPKASGTFVVILTAKGETQDKLYGNLLGADQYITKPFCVGELMRVVKELAQVRHKDFVVKSDPVMERMQRRQA
jgi:DNA-binding response OmpR family regulator